LKAESVTTFPPFLQHITYLTSSKNPHTIPPFHNHHIHSPIPHSSSA
jgi:hypothetical protein